MAHSCRAAYMWYIFRIRLHMTMCIFFTMQPTSLFWATSMLLVGPAPWFGHLMPPPAHIWPQNELKKPQNNMNYVIVFWTQITIWTHTYSQDGVKMGPKLSLRGSFFHESGETRDLFNQCGGPWRPSWSLLHWKSRPKGPNMASTRRTYKQNTHDDMQSIFMRTNP